MDRVVKKTTPRLFDKAFGYIQDALASQLTWLDHILPQAERLVKDINGKRVYSPNIYVEGNEYEQITPDSLNIGNYSFFILHEPQEIHYDVGSRVIAHAPFSLIVWLDIRSVDDGQRNIEQLKGNILRALQTTWMREGHFRINRIYQRAENIFKEFTLDEIDNQYLMQPYCGFRFQGEITIEDECAYVPPVEEDNNNGEEDENNG